MDSVVLLHLLHSLAPRFNWRLSALHVHHGISPNADAWAGFCADLCARYAIRLSVEHVDIGPLRNRHGVEAAARKMRHAALFRQPCDFVALAHHADDQAETLMLQLLRGAGVRGAAAMPLLKPANGSMHATVRPLLESPRASLFDYAMQQGLSWIEDESNAQERYERNFLRHRVMPVLHERFPDYRDTLGRSASHFSEAAGLLDELASLDAEGAIRDATLDVKELSALPPSRAKNLLRYFLHGQGAILPQTVQLEAMMSQLCSAREDAAVCVTFGGWQVRRFRGRAHVMPVLPRFDAEIVQHWAGQPMLPWPALDTHLSFATSDGGGIAFDKLGASRVTLKLRRGGEVLRLHANGHHRSLKNILQEQGVPPWKRERLPLLYCGDELVAIIGVAIHADYQANAGEKGLLVTLE